VAVAASADAAPDPQGESPSGGLRSLRGHRRPCAAAGGAQMILPGPESEMRTEFDALCAGLGVKVSVLAEVDDMAMMRLLARDTDALALVPSVVVRDELRDGVLREHCVVPGLFETFYAITVERHFQHPLLRTLLARGEHDMLAMGEG